MHLVQYRESVGIWRGENLSATVFGGRKTQPWKGHCSKLELDTGGAAGFSLGFGCRNWGKGFSLVSESMVDNVVYFWLVAPVSKHLKKI